MPKNFKKVSIVIPTFNRANLLTKTIESALAQTYPCEIIVCDHGSSDETPVIMNKYKDKVIYIRREKDLGMHFCWLEGVLNASSEFVHIHYDDDYMEPTFIEKTIEYMNDDIGMVFSDAKLLNLKTGKFFHTCLEISQKFGPTGIYDNDKLEFEIFNHSYMLSPAVCLYRKKDIIDALYQGDLPLDFGGTYKGVGPDHFMTLICLLRYKKFACINEELVVFGAHDNSITIDAQHNKQKLTKLENAYNAIRRFYNFFKLYKNNPSIIEQFIPAPQTPQTKIYKYVLLLGIPFIKVRISENMKKIYLFGIPVIILKTKRK